MQVHLGLDVGKTNLRIGVFGSDMALIEQRTFLTADVAWAQREMEVQMRDLRTKYRVQSAGISIFGPLQIDPNKPDYGAVIESSEPAWSGVNIPAQVAAALGQDVYFDFDVSAGGLALAQGIQTADRASPNFVYLSVGTGIGAVAFRDAHRSGYAPQLGHMYIPREPDDLEFPGSCRFHGGCLQGLASGKAMAERWGVPAENLPAGHPAWDLEARYIARACTNLIYSFSTDVIVLGSSVGVASGLAVSEIDRHTRTMLNDFLEPHLRDKFAKKPIVAAAPLGPNASLIGAALLGQQKVGLLHFPLAY